MMTLEAKVKVEQARRQRNAVQVLGRLLFLARAAGALR